MKQINPEHIDALLSLINSSPYFELLNIKVCELKKGYSKIKVDLDHKHLNPFGGVHGGVYASIIDTAAYWAVYCEMDEDTGYTSIDVCVNNLSMIKEGSIIVEGRTIKSGRSICLCQAVATDESGKIIAHGTSKLMILQGKQSIHHVIKTMGAQKLPCKFIDMDNQ